MYTCRECERDINQATEICPYCGADLTAPIGDETAAAAQKPTLGRLLLRWGLLIAALGSMLWGFLWYVLPERAGNPGARAESHAIAALIELHGALAEYSAAQGGAYPATLEILGDLARGPARKAQSEGYKLEYTPGTAGGGAVHNYALLARPGNFGYRNFYTDESGILRATRENRPATAQDPPI